MNGWRNDETCEVATWIGSDPGIYFAVLEYVAEDDAPTWAGFVEWSGLDGDTTGCPDFDSPNLDAEELTTLLLDMGEEG